MSDWDDLDLVCRRVGTRDLVTILHRGRVWLTGRRWDCSFLSPPDRIESQIAAAASISIRVGNIIATDPLYTHLHTFNSVRVHRPTLATELDAAGIAPRLPDRSRPAAHNENARAKLRLTIEGALKMMGMPGRQIQWNPFCDYVRSTLKVEAKTRGYGDKTIIRIVQEIQDEDK